jgi:hypothetical protein
MVISLGDLELAVDYINNRDVIKEELKKVKTAQSSPADSKGEQSAFVAGANKAVVNTPIDNEVKHKEEILEDIEVDDDNVEMNEEDIEMDEEDIEIDGENIEVDEEDMEIDEDGIEVDEDIEIDESELFGDESDSDEEAETDYDEQDSFYGDDEDEEVEAPVIQSKHEPKQVQGSNFVLSPLDLLNRKKGSDVVPNTSQKQEVKPKQNTPAIQQKPAVEHVQAAQQKPVVQQKPAVSKQVSQTASSMAVDKSKHSVDRQIHAVDNKPVSGSSRTLDEPAEQKADAGGMSKISMYSAMDEKALYKEVKKFLELRHVAKAPVDRKIVEAEFGVDNVLKLIKRGYLVSVGRGITIGY